MTTQQSCSEKSNVVKNYGFSGKYFLGELRRSWPFAVFLFIGFLIMMPVVALMGLQSVPVYIPEVRELTNDEILAYVLRIIETPEMRVVWGVVIVGVGMLSGWIMGKSLTNKVHSDFLHCLPIRREAIFATKFLTMTIDFIAAFLINSLLVVVACLVSSNIGAYGLGKIFATVFTFFFKGLLLYITSFSITNLACMLAGTTVMQIFLTAFLGFAPLAYYLMVYGITYTYANNLSAEYYYTFEFSEKICPIVKQVHMLITDVSAFDVISAILLDALLIFITIVLYRVRKVERAGTPVAFTPVAHVLKYLCIIPCTFFFGFLFEAMSGDDEGWRIIGYILGAFISLMFMNFILLKNARKMFAGMKGFAVYAAVMVLVVIGCSLDLFGIDTYVPRSEDLESVNITINGVAQNLEIREYKLKSEILKTYSDYLRDGGVSSNGMTEVYVESSNTIQYVDKYVANESNYLYHLSYTDEEGNDYKNTISFLDDNYRIGSNMKLVFKLENGIHLAVSMHLASNEKRVELARRVAQSMEYSKKIVECLDTEKLAFASYTPIIKLVEEIYWYDSDYRSEEDAIIEKMMEALKAEYSKKNVFTENSMVVGYFSIRTKEPRVEIDIPVFATFDELKLFTGCESKEALCEKLAEMSEYMVICDVTQIDTDTTANECSVLITDKEQMKQAFSCMYSIGADYNSAYHERDDKYMIVYGMREEDYKYYEEEETTYHIVDNRTRFGKGNIPAFVSEIFK